MTVLEFVTKYNGYKNSASKTKMISNIKITPYVSIVKKDAYAQLIVDKTMFEQEKYDDNGIEKYHKTDRLKVNSVAQYVQFCRVVIELYTDLEIDENDSGFIQGYDALKSSGLLNTLMIGDEQSEPLIPISELNEFKSILDMKISDTLQNHGSIQSFIERQVDKFKILGETTLSPLANVISEKISDVSKEDMNKIIEFAKRGDFKEV